MNVHERLKLIAKKYPELKPLASRLVKEQMTPVWYRDYRALNCRAKPVLLQIYLGKPWLVSNLDEQYGSRKASIRLFKTLLAEYPELPDTPLFAWRIRRSAVPVSFAKQLSLPRVSGSLQFRDWLFSGKLPTTDDNEDVIRRLKQRCFFDEAAAERCFVEERSRENSRKLFTRYFDSDIEEIWAPNVIYYLYFFIRRYYPNGGGLMEKTIPVDLSRMLGIRKNTILDVLTLIDLLYLGSRDVLSEKAVARDYPRVSVLIRYLKRDRFRRESDAFATTGYLHPGYVPRLYQNRKRMPKPIVFAPFFWFDMQSLLGYGNVGPVSRLYRHIDINRYNTLARGHFADYCGGNDSRIRRLLSMQPKIKQSLELRSFVNMMIYLDTLVKRGSLRCDDAGEFDYMDALLIAARYQFGETRRSRAVTGQVKRPYLEPKPKSCTTNRWIERMLGIGK